MSPTQEMANTACVLHKVKLATFILPTLYSPKGNMRDELAQPDDPTRKSLCAVHCHTLQGIYASQERPFVQHGSLSG